ncbi:MAG TPA: cytochrome c [Edaphobacter sp.]|jgi:cytochrome c5
MAKRSSRGGGTGKMILGFLFGVAVAAGAGYVWLHKEVLPESLRKSLPSSSSVESPHGAVTTSAQPKPPVEHSRRTPPFGISEDVFESGARVYQARCANCHGTPRHDAAFGKQMSPAAAQLWRKTKAGSIGVSRQEPGEIYEKTANGVSGSGMPAFHRTLTDTELWQVSLLLKNADQGLPDPVLKILETK